MSELLLHAAEVSVISVMVWLSVCIGAARERGRKPKVKEPNLQCGCYHVLAFHDGLGSCQHTDTIQTGNNKIRELACTCQQYTGDVPADWYGRAVMREMDGGASLPELPAPSTEEERKAS